MNKVYLIHAVGTDRYKIGVTTKSIQKRLHSLQTGSPYVLRCLATIESREAHILESRLHHRFKNYRVQGEWFKFDENTPGIEETFNVRLKMRELLCPVLEPQVLETAYKIPILFWVILYVNMFISILSILFIFRSL